MSILNVLFGQGTSNQETLLTNRDKQISMAEFPLKFGHLSESYEFARCQAVALHLLNYEVPL
jgi:hypothetical protein